MSTAPDSVAYRLMPALDGSAPPARRRVPGFPNVCGRSELSRAGPAWSAGVVSRDADARLVADMSGTARQGRQSTPELGGFIDVAREAFRFLEPHLSPHAVCETPELAVLRFSTDDTAVDIIHDRLRGGELYVTLTRRIAGRDRSAIEQEWLGDVIAVDHDLASIGVRTFVVRPDHTALLRRCVGQLAHLTRRYATPVIAGDVAWFRRRDQQRNSNAPGNRIGGAR